jgi:hypothetical protein
MCWLSRFFTVYTGLFVTLYSHSISGEFKNIENKLNMLNNQNITINNELLELRKDFNYLKDSKKFKYNE